MLDHQVLAAGDVRSDFFRALEPMTETVASVLPAGAEAIVDRVRLLVQLRPLVVRVALIGAEDRPARDLGVLRATGLPDRGERLEAAFLAVVAGICAGLGRAGETAIETALSLRGIGGFVLVAEPGCGDIELRLAAPGEDLGEALVLGSIASMPSTAH